MDTRSSFSPVEIVRVASRRCPERAEFAATETNVERVRQPLGREDGLARPVGRLWFTGARVDGEEAREVRFVQV